MIADSAARKWPQRCNSRSDQVEASSFQAADPRKKYRQLSRTLQPSEFVVFVAGGPRTLRGSFQFASARMVKDVGIGFEIPVSEPDVAPKPAICTQTFLSTSV